MFGIALLLLLEVPIPESTSSAKEHWMTLKFINEGRNLLLGLHLQDSVLITSVHYFNFLCYG